MRDKPVSTLLLLLALVVSVGALALFSLLNATTLVPGTVYRGY